MSLAAVGSIVFSLALVLGLVGVAARLLQRFAGRIGSGRSGLPLEVVQRVALGPKQGVAIVRIGERAIAVSMGEGGVHTLLELDEEARRALEAPVQPAIHSLAPAPRFRAAFRAALRGAAVIAALAAMTMAAGVGEASAQQRPVAVPEVAADRPNVEAIDTALTRIAPSIDLRVGDEGEGGLRLSGTVGVVVMMGLLTLLPTLLLMMTSFTRILVVMHFLRQAMGTQSAPPAHLVAALSLLLTGFVMAPTLKQVNETALQPWMNGRIEQAEMMKIGAGPFRQFMTSQVRERDLGMFMDLAEVPQVSSVDEVPMVVLVSAFVTSELRTAFQIGFALFLPFIIIDLVVAAVLMSMGMFMLPPAMIALPVKLLLFVLVDGWSLIVQGLISSFH
jgi:flagellar biosynthesis protein FliP